MTNHPNRNWRQRMEQAADQFLESSAGKVLVEVPIDRTKHATEIASLRWRIREAYLLGYQDGRKRDERP
jgi:hypothetical protein